MKRPHFGQLYLPALQAKMGDRVYYIAFMKMEAVAQRIKSAGEIHQSSTLSELIQRQLTDRAPAIRDYILNQDQRFFNALVIGVYGGDPQWLEIAVSNTEHSDTGHDIPTDLDGAFGYLTLSGKETLFAIDGQHRVEGIRAAVKELSGRCSEEVATIFVGHSPSETGLARTRRLFTTLNRYAKPINKQEAIVLDEDDAVAIITRSLVEDHPFLRDRVSTHRTKSLPKSDRTNITTIIALYDAMNIYLKDKPARQWNRFKSMRPPEDVLQKFGDRAKLLWKYLQENIGALKFYGNSQADMPAKPYRHAAGGHLLFRPVGLLIVVKTIRLLEDHGRSVRWATRDIAQVPLNLEDPPWARLLWDPSNKRMITAPVNQRAAAKILLFGAGGDLAWLKSSVDALKNELAGLLITSADSVTLEQFVG